MPTDRHMMMMMMMMMTMMTMITMMTFVSVAATDEATTSSSQYFVQTLTRMADSNRAKLKEVCR